MSGILTTPDDAEEAFYDAIARADLDALMNLWAEDEEIVFVGRAGAVTSDSPTRKKREAEENLLSELSASI